MPVIDARSMDQQQANVRCDVCIVGAGAAGIYLGARLADMGLGVVILEAGGRGCTEGASAGIEAAFEDATYNGAIAGRFFGLGGSTSHWGGLLVPHSERDYRPTPEADFDPWRHIVAVVIERSGDVSRALGMGGSDDRGAMARDLLGEAFGALHSSGLDVRLADFLPFRRKNLAFLLDKPLQRTGRLTVFLHAVAMSWHIVGRSDGLTQLMSVTARTGDHSVSVRAHSFVLAAGAIESARMLLEMERQLGSSPFRRGAAVGRYLGDHLSCSVAEVKPEDRPLAAKLFAPRFVKGCMRSFRFLERSAPAQSPRSFSHFIFENQNDGFQLAKKVLTGLQSRKLRKVSLSELSRGATGLAALGWNRVVRSRLHIAHDTPVHLQLDVEQRPDYNNTIRLGDRIDALGRPIPIIKWDVRKADYEAIRTIAGRLVASWPARKSGLPRLLPWQGVAAAQKPHDAYHPVGMCRMGTDREAAVDPDLRVHGTANLIVLSTAVFPSAGTANPTFSMLCLAERLGQHLAKQVPREDVAQAVRG